MRSEQRGDGVRAMRSMQPTRSTSVAAEATEQVIERIRRDRDRRRLRGLLLKGAKSEPESTADGAFFDSLRQRVVRRPTT